MTLKITFSILFCISIASNADTAQIAYKCNIRVIVGKLQNKKVVGEIIFTPTYYWISSKHKKHMKIIDEILTQRDDEQALVECEKYFKKCNLVVLKCER